MSAKLTPEDLQTAMARHQREREEAAIAKRAALLAELRALGVTRIDARYNGYGDSGDVEDITETPKSSLGGLHGRVSDFVWQFSYDLHPGFEINEGGQGEFTWHIDTDRIDVRHEAKVTEVDVTEHEGL